jgi:hypothetical protein
VKDAIASYDVLVNLLGKTMAQVLSVLALSTTAMKDGLIQ